MRILYVSRQFNRSGYHILRHLLQSERFKLATVIVPPVSTSQKCIGWLNRPLLAPIEQARYRAAVRYYRGQHLRFEGSIPRLARTWDIPVLELPTLRSESALRSCRELDIDLIVLGGGWPELISPSVLELPPLGAINTHPSLLPEFRGTDIHRWQILAGIDTSGVTIHYMDARFDTGGILGQAKVALTGDETPQDLFEMTARASGPLMLDVLDRISSSRPDRAPSLTQPHRTDARRYHSKWPWDDPTFMTIDWRAPASQIERLVRASAQESYRYLGPTFSVDGDRFILRRASKVPSDRPLQTGELDNGDDGAVSVGTGDPNMALRLDAVQEFSSVPNLHRSHPGRWLAARLGARNSTRYLDLAGEDDDAEQP